MTKFTGFPAGKVRFTRIPASFFTELLPQIDDLDELKVTLYAFWRLDRMEGNLRYLRLVDFLGDEFFMKGLRNRGAVEAALNSAVERGTFLRAELELEGKPLNIFLLNTQRGQSAVQTIQAGNWQPSGNPEFPIALDLEKPNIFRLYEENIGPLTPMLSESLKEAEEQYPPDWIEEAVRIAVENNARKWRYIEAILQSWQTEGKDDRTDRGSSQTDSKKYTEGKFSDYIER